MAETVDAAQRLVAGVAAALGKSRPGIPMDRSSFPPEVVVTL